MEKKSRDIEKEDSHHSVFSRSLMTGFIGGLIFSGIGIFMYYFNFAEVAPKSFLLRSWLTDSWTDSWIGDIVSILLAGIVSIVVAVIYYILFRKRQTIWAGIIYGVGLWVALFYILHPLFPIIPQVNDLETNTIISTLCLFISYGLFIGYSISYDYLDLNDIKVRGIRSS